MIIYTYLAKVNSIEKKVNIQQIFIIQTLGLFIVLGNWQGEHTLYLKLSWYIIDLSCPASQIIFWRILKCDFRICFDVWPFVETCNVTYLTQFGGISLLTLLKQQKREICSGLFTNVSYFICGDVRIFESGQIS